ncbi:kielin/chordin-like protein [Glandiceps talaboti]
MASCIANNIEYLHNTTWTSPFDECEFCTCLEGTVNCIKQICDKCTHPLPIPGDCCGKCEECMYNGVIHSSGEVFVPANDTCSQCLCMEGNVNCIQEECQLVTCPNPIQGPCCPICEASCFFENQVFQSGETFQPEGYYCRMCICMDGQIECENVTCPVPPCEEQFQTTEAGVCCPFCTNLPGCVDSSGILYPFGQTWIDKDDLCKSCECKDNGLIMCEIILCNLECTNPIIVLNQCCPDCNGCTYDGISYREGATFPPSDDSCNTCECTSGSVQCQPMPCVVKCSHPYLPPNECCPDCLDCLYQGQFISNGDFIHPFGNRCETCVCALGNVVCSATDECPPLTCEETIPAEGDCCPVCRDAMCRTPDGVEYKPGDMWTSEDPCVQCNCQATGDISCRILDCPVSCDYGIFTDGECCPDCIACDFNGVLYPSGDIFYPNGDVCRTCTCQSGNVSCEVVQCELTTCSNSIMLPGECCPKCLDCVDDAGISHHHGQIWTKNDDPCTTCVCDDTEIMCRTVVCPAPCDNPISVPGQCCKACQGCEFEDVMYEEGAIFKPDDDQCLECQCRDGILLCLPIICAIPSCTPELVMVEQGSCCPTCRDDLERFEKVCKNNSTGMEYQNGTQFQLNACTSCMCMDGHITCEVEECDELECPVSRQKLRPDDCCPVCLGLSECTFDNKEYSDGDQFIPAGDSCSVCFCINGSVTCERPDCEPINCDEENQIFNEGDCCPKCTVESFCMHEGKRYQSGGSWQTGCDICDCFDGRTTCITENCKEVICTEEEEVGRVKEECCERCVPKSSSCIAFGDPHYRTFDGRYFSFQGTCTYVLAKDCSQNRFKIVAQHDGKSTYAVAWTEAIEVTFDDWVILLMADFEVTVNGEKVEIPYILDTTFSLERIGLLLVLHTDIGIRVSWDGSHFVEVTADGTYKDQLCGLCGNFNDDPSDDFLNVNGTIERTASAFGNSWLAEIPIYCSCRDGEEIDICGRAGALVQLNANQQCNILRGPLFRPAHRAVDPQPYYKACRSDMCACPVQEKCLCDVLLAYAHEARKKGIILNWRQSSVCAVSCPKGAVYAECTPACIETCDNFNSLRTHCIQDDCVPGCMCAAGTVLHQLECIPPSQCPQQILVPNRK